MDWKADDQSVTASVAIGHGEGRGELQFRATNLRVERAHRHATISVIYNNTILDEDDISISKREERTRLANSSQKALHAANPHRGYSQANAQSDLLTFCRELWDRWMDQRSFIETYGSAAQTVPFLLTPFIIQDSGTIIFAPPGSGKSWLALAIAMTLDSGATGLWTPQKQINVLYINLERSQRSFERRIGTLNVALGNEREHPLKMLHGRGSSLIDIADTASRVVENNHIELVVLDSLSRAGSSLVDDAAANKTMDTLNRITDTPWGCAWLAVGHTPRNDSKHLFGSQMFTAAADLEIGVECSEVIGRIEGDDVVVPGYLYQRITTVKSNDVGKASPMALRYTMNAFGVEQVEHIAVDMYPKDDSTEADEDEGPTRDLTNDELAFIKTSGGVTAAQFGDYHSTSPLWAEKILSRSSYLIRSVDGGRATYRIISETMDGF